MPDKVVLNSELGIIEISSFGVVSSRNIYDSIEKIKEIYNNSGVNKVLVDTTKQEQMPGTVGIFQLFSSMPKEIAFVLFVKESQLTEEDLVFAETVAVNRGVRMKIFYDKSLALEWLDDA